jgi:hypothetical protein
MGQDAVGAFAAHRIAAPARRAPRHTGGGRHALVVIGVLVLVASFAGMLAARV